MKSIMFLILVLSGLVSITHAQRTSKNNYTGDWEDGNSWTGGVAPPGTLNATHVDLTINGFITRTGNLTASGATIAGDFIINDTLVIIGNLTFNNDASPLLIGPNAVFIVIGNVSFGNNTSIENDGIFVVTGTASFANGNSEDYDDSGGGELFIEDGVTENPDASGSNDWGNLDDLYPTIYDFVLCEQSGGSNCILPVVLSYFEVTLTAGIVELKWATTMEENFREFVVQRSANGTEFEDIGTVAGKGFDIYDIESKYSFMDLTPLIGFNYYRLKAIDLDDRYETFGIKVIRLSAPKHVSVYPNPSQGEIISYSTNFNPAESARVVVVNQIGVEIFHGSAIATTNTIVFDGKLVPGIYFLRYASGDFSESVRIVIRK